MKLQDLKVNLVKCDTNGNGKKSMMVKRSASEEGLRSFMCNIIFVVHSLLSIPV